MPKATITLKHLFHRNESQIGLYFDCNAELIAEVKKLNGVRWSRSNKCWYVENNPENLRTIFTTFKDIAPLDLGDFFRNNEGREKSLSKRTNKIDKVLSNAIPEEYTGLLKRRRYSENTIKTYRYYFSEYINHFPGLKISDLTEEHIRQYQDYLLNKKKVAQSTQNQAINAINPVGSK